MTGPELASGQRNRALLCAGCVAWALMVLVNIFLPSLASAADWKIVQTWLGLSALVGLPVALLISFSLGGWQLDKCVRHSRTGWSDAAKAGAKVGMILGTVSLAFTAMRWLEARLDEHGGFSSNLYDDGVPTPFGLLVEGLEFVVTTLIGATSGLSARWSLGWRWGATSKVS